jgi:MFS family permease
VARLLFFVGRLSDLVGRRATMLAACLLLGVLAIPAYVVAGGERWGMRWVRRSCSRSGPSRPTS